MYKVVIVPEALRKGAGEYKWAIQKPDGNYLISILGAVTPNLWASSRFPQVLVDELNRALFAKVVITKYQ